MFCHNPFSDVNKKESKDEDLKHLVSDQPKEALKGTEKVAEKEDAEKASMGSQVLLQSTGKQAPDKTPGESVTGSKTSRSETRMDQPVPGGSSVTKTAEGHPEFHARHKFKAAGYAAQASVKAANYQKGSKACVIL
jgi:hypothetical protein